MGSLTQKPCEPILQGICKGEGGEIVGYRRRRKEGRVEEENEEGRKRGTGAWVLLKEEG